MRSGSYIKAMGDDDSGDSDTSPKPSPKIAARRESYLKATQPSLTELTTLKWVLLCHIQLFIKTCIFCVLLFSLHFLHCLCLFLLFTSSYQFRDLFEEVCSVMLIFAWAFFWTRVNLGLYFNVILKRNLHYEFAKYFNLLVLSEHPDVYSRCALWMLC